VFGVKITPPVVGVNWSNSTTSSGVATEGAPTKPLAIA
jgi:hypothetical protein